MKRHVYWAALPAVAACGATQVPHTLAFNEPSASTHASQSSEPEAPTTAEPQHAAEGELLPTAKSALFDNSIPRSQLESMTLAARRYYGFWNTGDVRLAQAALAPNFLDRTLPKGRPQGPDGPIFASEQFRRAVPDLRAEVEEMLIVGDRVVGRLRFSGHFTGTFGAGAAARTGDGRAVDFIATDIYRIVTGRIVENWHLEDNLTLLQQLGVVAGAS